MTSSRGASSTIRTGPALEPGSHIERLTADADTRVWRVTTTIVCTASRHDTIAAYKNEHCRCPVATRRTVDYERRRNAGLIAPSAPATMTRRRLQALATIGWTCQIIGPIVRRDPVSLTEIRRGKRTMVTGRTAHAVHRLYRKIHDQQGPSDRTRAHARREGWEGPSTVLMYYDVDEVAVQRAVAGDPPAKLPRGERLDAVEQMQRAGCSYDVMAARLRIDPRQVARDLADLTLTVPRLDSQPAPAVAVLEEATA
jgi:hypothetical protein